MQMETWGKEDVAKVLGVSTRTVDRWRTLGKLKACQVMKKGRVRFLPESVERFLRESEKNQR